MGLLPQPFPRTPLGCAAEWNRVLVKQIVVPLVPGPVPKMGPYGLLEQLRADCVLSRCEHFLKAMREAGILAIIRLQLEPEWKSYRVAKRRQLAGVQRDGQVSQFFPNSIVYKTIE